MSEPLYRLPSSPSFTVCMLKCRSHHHHQCYIEARGSECTARGSAGMLSLLAAGHRCSSRSFRGLQPTDVTIHRRLSVQVTRLLGLSHHPYQRDTTPGDLPQCIHGDETLAYHLTPHLSTAWLLKPYCTENRGSRTRGTQAREREVFYERMFRQYLACDRCVTPVTVYHQTLPLSPLVQYPGLPARMIISRQCSLCHVSARPVVVSL